MKKLCYLTLIFLSIYGCSAPESIPVSFDVTIEIPEDRSKPEAGQFIPVDTPLKLNMTLDSNEALPAKTKMAIRIIDHRNIEYQRNSWPLPDFSGGQNQFVRLYRISKLPGSRKVHIQVALTDEHNSEYSLAESDNSPWKTIFSGYALHNSIKFSQGWHTPDKAADSNTEFRWSKGTSIIHFAQPLFPSLLKLSGFSQPQCFPDNQWIFTVTLNEKQQFQDTITQENFGCLIPLAPLRLPPNQMPDTTWPVGEMELKLQGDQTFVPMDCSNQPDKRHLAYNIKSIELTEFIPDSGFYQTSRENDAYWPAPDFSVTIPRHTHGHLYIQGIRPVECIEMPQTVTVTMAGHKLPPQIVTDEWFCLKWPMPNLPIEITDSIPIRVTVSPVFFRAQCMDTDDNRPYCLGLEEIVVR